MAVFSQSEFSPGRVWEYTNLETMSWIQLAKKLTVVERVGKGALFLCLLFTYICFTL